MAETDDPVGAFENLSPADLLQLRDINTRLRKNKAPWGERKGGEACEDGVIEIPYWQHSHLAREVVEFLYEKGLNVVFNWSEWDEGREWYKSEVESKYDNLDVETVLKLLTAVVRNDRFHDGVLISTFESGEFPRLKNKLTELA